MRYRVFISYSHIATARLAPALQAGLHRFARPWLKLRALSAFRDQSDLSVSPDLWSEIKKALLDSEYLLLLCSPHAASSKWIAREIEFWLENRSPDSVLLIQTEGQILWDENAGDFDWSASDAVPAALNGVFSHEPFFLDLRWARDADDTTLRNPRFRDAVATIAARLHGTPKNELIGRDVREHRKLLRFAWSGVSALLVLFAASMFATFLAVKGQRAAVRQSEIAQARELNAHAELARARNLDQLPLSTLLALESLQRVPSVEADQTLMTNLGLLPRRIASYPIDIAQWATVRFSLDGSVFVMREEDGPFAIVETLTGTVLQKWDDPEQTGPRISGDKAYVATVDEGLMFPYSDDVYYATVRETETGATVARMPHPQGSGGYLLSPTGSFLALRRREVLTLWDVGRDQEAFRFEFDGSVNTFVFAPDESSIAVSTSRGHHLLSLVDGSSIVDAEQGESLDADFLDESIVAFAVSEGPTVSFYDTQSGEEIASTSVDSTPERLEFSPKGDVLGVLTDNASLTFLDLSDLSQRTRVALADEDDSFYGFSETGELYATSTDGAVQIWQSGTNDEIARIAEELYRAVISLAWGASGDRISVQIDKTISVLDPVSGPWVYRSEHSHHVRAVSFSPDGRLFASAGIDRAVRVLDIDTGVEEALIFLGPAGGVDALEFSPDGRYLAIAGDSAIYFFSTVFESEVEVVGPNGSPVAYFRDNGAEFTLDTGSRAREISFDANGNLAAATENGLALWSIADRRQIQDMQPFSGAVYDVVFDDSSQWIATAEGTTESEDGVISGANQARIWSWPTKAEVARFPHEFAVGVVALSTDSRYLATASRSAVRIWDTRSQELVRLLTHERPVNSMVFDRSGTRLITGTGPTIIRAGPHLVTVWDLETGQELKRIEHKMAVFDVALSPDETYIASGSQDQSAYVWLWQPDDVIREACGRLLRNLSQAEWDRYIGAEPYRPTCPDLPVPEPTP